MDLESGIKRKKIHHVRNVLSEFDPKKKNLLGTSKVGTLEPLTVVKNHDTRNLLALDRKNHGNEARRKKIFQNHQTLAHRRKKEKERSGKKMGNLQERKNGIRSHEKNRLFYLFAYK
jgi:hypothetical protein